LKRIKKKLSQPRKIRKRGRGTYKSGKPPIITMVCRKTRKVIFSVAKSLSARLIRYKIRKHCQGKVIVYTDEYSIYRGLKKLTKVEKHETVTHSDYIYAVGDTHVNNCENRHSLLRPALSIFRGVSKKNI